MPLHLGVDLAWGEGTATRPPNETGLAAIDEHGTVVDAGWARGVDAVEEWIARLLPSTATIAIDASLVVTNPSGAREAEREVARRYGRWHVFANPTNLGTPYRAGIRLRERLEARGVGYLDRIPGDGIRSADAAPAMFECYPYTTLVGAEELGYTERRPRYKRLDRALPPAAARAARAEATDELVRRMARLADADPPLVMASHPLSRALVDQPSPLTGPAHKHREDLIDALLCAWTAALLRRRGDERMQALGASAEPDPAGRRPVIIAAARPEQRRPE